MAFWDIFSNNAARWNALQQDSNTRVCQALNAFVGAKSAEGRYDDNCVVSVRNELYTFFLVARRFVDSSLNGDWQEMHYKFAGDSLRDRITALSLTDYMSLLSVIHAEILLLLYGMKAEGVETPRAEQVWYDRYLGLLLDGFCWMYSRPASVAESWQRCRDWLKPNSPKLFVPALSHKADDDIGLILGTTIHPLESLWRRMWWSDRCKGVFTELKDPEWWNSIETEMAAHRQ